MINLNRGGLIMKICGLLTIILVLCSMIFISQVYACPLFINEGAEYLTNINVMPIDLPVEYLNDEQHNRMPVFSIASGQSYVLNINFYLTDPTATVFFKVLRCGREAFPELYRIVFPSSQTSEGWNSVNINLQSPNEAGMNEASIYMLRIIGVAGHLGENSWNVNFIDGVFTGKMAEDLNWDNFEVAYQLAVKVGGVYHNPFIGSLSLTPSKSTLSPGESFIVTAIYYRNYFCPSDYYKFLARNEETEEITELGRWAAPYWEIVTTGWQTFTITLNAPNQQGSYTIKAIGCSGHGTSDYFGVNWYDQRSDGGFSGHIPDELSWSFFEVTAEFIINVGDILHVSGTWEFRNEDGTADIGIKLAKVELHEMDGPIDHLLETFYCDDQGEFDFPTIPNDDGLIGEDGLDIYLKIIAENQVVSVTSGIVGDIFEISYWSRYPNTGTIYNIESGEHVYNLVVTDDKRGAWNIFNTIVEGHEFLLGEVSYDASHMNIYWPRSDTYYDPLITNAIFLLSGDEWDSDVVLHEYGHFIMDNVYLIGPWTGWRNKHTWMQRVHPGLAWSEGWADFFQGIAQNDPQYIDAGTSPGAEFNLESPNIINLNSDPQGGRDVEGAVAGILWDIVDSTNENGDGLTMSFSDVWTVFVRSANTWKLVKNHLTMNIENYWDCWFEAGKNNKNELEAIYILHGVLGPIVRDIKKDLLTLKNDLSALSNREIRDVLKKKLDAAKDKLDDALDKIGNGKNDVAQKSLKKASDLLTDFVNSIMYYRDKGKIPYEQASALINSAQTLITRLNSML